MPLGSKVPFQVYGLQRTGTNLAHHYLSTYFNGQRVSTSWKHGEPTWRHPAVVTVKNPKAWAVSFWRWVQVQKGRTRACDQFSTFLRTRVPKTGHDPVSLYNLRYREYLRGPCIVLVRHEEVVADMCTTFQKAAKKLGMEKTRPLEVVKKRVGPSGHRALDLDQYRNKTYLSELTSADHTWIMDNVDTSLMKDLGYA